MPEYFQIHSGMDACGSFFAHLTRSGKFPASITNICFGKSFPQSAVKHSSATAAVAEQIQCTELHAPVSAALKRIPVGFTHCLIPLPAVFELLHKLAVRHIVRLHRRRLLRMLLRRNVVALSRISHGA